MREKHKFPLHFSFPIFQRTSPRECSGKCVPFLTVEIKSFTGPSDINEFHRAMGQFNDYFVALEIVEPDRRLFLAIPEETWLGFFQEKAIQRAVERIGAKIIVYSPLQQNIRLWIK